MRRPGPGLTMRVASLREAACRNRAVIERERGDAVFVYGARRGAAIPYTYDGSSSTPFACIQAALSAATLGS